MTKLFKGLILADLAIYLAWYFLPVFDTPYLSEQSLELLSRHGYGALINVSYAMDDFLFAVGIIVTLGMYFFVPIARVVFLILLLTGIVLTQFYGVVVETGVSRMLGSVVTLLDGVIIAMAFSEPVRNHFRANTKSQVQ